MSNSPLVSHVHISPNSYNPRRYPIEKVTIHHMAGNLSVEACGDVFASAARPASSNYGVGSDGRVGLYVDEANAAWTSASYDNDNRAVTIEVADEDTVNWIPSAAAFRSTVELCADICRRNGIGGLSYYGNPSGTMTEHLMFAATSCPGPWWHARMSRVADIVNAKLWGQWPDGLDPWEVINGRDGIEGYLERKRWEEERERLRREEEERRRREEADLKEIGTPAGGGDVYRLYNPYSGQHHFTSSAEERGNLAAAGWEDEGVGWRFPPTPGVVYRLYEPDTGDHLYTADFAEAKAAQESGYLYEGANFSSAPGDGGAPVWRLYNPHSGRHMFTADGPEADALAAAGWTKEGVAFYGEPRG